MADTSYQQDIEIDPDALDIQWTKQAQTFFKYAELAAKARNKVDRLKESLEVLDANLGLQIRKAPLNYGLEKVTEGALQSCILLNPQHANASKELADAQYELEILAAAVRALDQKKAALENLVRLQGQNYFAAPSVPRDIGAEWVKEKERESARSAVKRKLNR